MQDPFHILALKEIQNLVVKLNKYGFSVSDSTKKMYNYEVTVNSKSEQAKLLIYFGKKGIKKVIQANPESNIFKVINNVVFDPTFFKDEKKSEIDFEQYIGTDESGKGDYFGPLVIGAVYIDKKTTAELEKIGVKDSKLISDNSIKILEPKIKKIVDGHFEIIQINPEKYNLIYQSFKNLNKLMAWAHSKAIENLVLKSKCTDVISDKFGNEKLISDELKKKNIEINHFQTTKGERFTAVAAASILARAKVIDWFYFKSKELGFEIPKGGGAAATIVAKRVFNQFDERYLRKMIKFHFKNSQSIFKQ
ncbi:MAG: ribonuclease HIII [Ignavibacteriales bacterium]|nr:ribonuclease HIII [Ignavibacteriales bacterium]